MLVKPVFGILFNKRAPEKNAENREINAHIFDGSKFGADTCSNVEFRVNLLMLLTLRRYNNVCVGGAMQRSFNKTFRCEFRWGRLKFLHFLKNPFQVVITTPLITDDCHRCAFFPSMPKKTGRCVRSTKSSSNLWWWHSIWGAEILFTL